MVVPETGAYASRGTWVRTGDVLGSGTCGYGCLLELWVAKVQTRTARSSPETPSSCTSRGSGRCTTRSIAGINRSVRCRVPRYGVARAGDEPAWRRTRGLHELGDGYTPSFSPTVAGWSNAGLIVADGASLLIDTLFDLTLHRRDARSDAPVARAEAHCRERSTPTATAITATATSCCPSLCRSTPPR